MPLFQLSEEIAFPRPDLAEDNGLLALGGDLSIERLLNAYALGIFPWYSEGDPILWWSPDPRLVLYPQTFHESRSLQRVRRSEAFRVTMDQAFDKVIAACARQPRPGQDGTWITDEMQAAYRALHDAGFAHSVECWSGDRLVGGLYGVSLGGCFFGESMFSTQSNASKVALATLVERLAGWDFDLIDCQVHTGHLERLGAQEIGRTDFLETLAESMRKPTRRGVWTISEPA
jgi:leucyl/phenylalanyl-tRNA--protein transferase